MLGLTGAAGVAVAILVGVAGGFGTYTFIYAGGASYLRDDPTVCANCHVMQDHLDAWAKSSHRSAATCNDCHAPHDGLLAKLWVKGLNGFNHSRAFTTGNYPEPLRITPMNRRVTEDACRACHESIVQAIDPAAMNSSATGERMSCIRCHADVGHPR